MQRAKDHLVTAVGAYLYYPVAAGKSRSIVPLNGWMVVNNLPEDKIIMF